MPELTPSAALQRAALFPLLVLVCLAIAATAFVAFTLIARGIDESRPSWILMGALGGLFWLFALRLSLRRPRPSS